MLICWFSMYTTNFKMFDARADLGNHRGKMLLCCLERVKCFLENAGWPH